MFSRIEKRGCFYFAIAVFVCLLASSLRAQTVGATVSGTVADPSGSVIPNAQVAIRDTETGSVTTVSSNSQFLLPSRCGSWEMRNRFISNI